MKVGFFDSGLGGLQIAKAVQAHMNIYSYIFYGDTANVPYGNKSEVEIEMLTRAGVQTLFDLDAKLVVVACNTASVQSVRTLQQTMLTHKYADRKILGVVIPTVETIIESNVQTVTLIGTHRTIASKKFEIELLNRSPRPIKIDAMSTPELVPLIEQGKLDDACSYLQSVVPKERVGEVLVLGCTHYSVLKNQVRAWYTESQVLSQDEIIPQKLSEYLLMHPEIESELTQVKNFTVKLSDESFHYAKFY
jgi:glutamate racemase